jgi:hypothetical protein
MKKILVFLIGLLFASPVYASHAKTGVTLGPCGWGLSIFSPDETTPSQQKLFSCYSRNWGIDWPTLTSGTGTLGYWKSLETAQGVYPIDSNFQSWATNAHTANQQTIFTFGKVPQWANSNNGLSGGGYLPSNPQDGYDFITHMSQLQCSGRPCVDIFDVWNEPAVFSQSCTPPNSGISSCNSYDDLIIFATHLISLSHANNSKVIVSMPSTCCGYEGAYGMDDFLTKASVAGITFDAINVHQYNPCQRNGGNNLLNNPEGIIPCLDNAIQVATKWGYASKPFYINETGVISCNGGSYPNNPAFPTSDCNLAYTTIEQLIEASSGADMWTFWGCDSWLMSSVQNLCTNLGNIPVPRNILSDAGLAYARVEATLAGGQFTTAIHRVTSTNLLPNLPWVGCVAGVDTPGSNTGTLPTGLSLSAADTSHGISTTISECGTFTDKTGATAQYFKIHIYGNYSGGGNGFVRIFGNTGATKLATNGQGQYWTFGQYMSMTAGTMTCLHQVLPKAFELDTNGNFLNGQLPYMEGNFVPGTDATIANDYFEITSTVPDAAAIYQDFFDQFSYDTSCALDVTLLIGGVSADQGVQYYGDVTEANGTLARFVWDSSKTRSSTATYTAPGSYTYQTLLDGQGNQIPIVASTVQIFNVPLLLESAQHQPQWMP